MSICERSIRLQVNPSDLLALEKAVQLRENHGGRVTVLAIGPERIEDYLRTGFAMGGDRAIRINDRYLTGYDDTAMSRILSRAFDILQPSLILTGSQLVDRGFDAIVPLAGARSGIPWVQNVVSIALLKEKVETLKKTDWGGRLMVETPLPAGTCYAGEGTGRYPDMDAVLQSLDTPITVWCLAELGLSNIRLSGNGGATVLEKIASPRPDPLRVVTPDPTLPAFDWILALLAGGVTPRQGEVRVLSAEETADALLGIIQNEGLLSGER
jgi:electron transfer flavoprotein beta subunit